MSPLWGGELGVNVGCASDGEQSECSLTASLLPVELGELFQFNATASTFVPDCQEGERPCPVGLVGYANIGFSYEFFEADGVTPVPVGLAAPEPRTFVLLTVGFLGLLGLRSKFVQRLTCGVPKGPVASSVRSLVQMGEVQLGARSAGIEKRA